MAPGAVSPSVDLVANVSRRMADGKQRLVIVESPAKARTISRYLGAGYDVESSIGHIRDLPEKASQIPAAKREKYGALGVAVEDDFEPYYIVDPEKKKVVAGLKKKLAEADELLLATDEDREGEAIAWHLVQALQPKVPVRRMVFHEITKDAIVRALDETRDVDERLVDSQETRRILDRLYGYEVSPVLWKKVMRGLSAGRVQSVATRLVVEREIERMRFVVASYWDVVGTFDPGAFEARLVAVDGKRVAQGKDFGSTGIADGSVARPRRGAGARRSPVISTAGRSRSPPSRRSRTAEARPRPSAPPRSSRRRAGSSATRRRRRCGSPSGSTRTATSRTCGRIRSRCPRRPCVPPGRTPSERTARRRFPTRRAATSGRSRTRRRRTRRSAPRVTSSARPEEIAGEVSPRRARALRADLQAHGRLADDGCDRPDGLDSARRRHRAPARRRRSARPAR